MVIPLVRDVLFVRNKALAFWAAGRFRRWAEEDDLGQVALCGLFQAAGAFAPGRGRFSTFAVECMRRRLVSHVRKERSWRRYVPARLEEPLRGVGEDESRTLGDALPSPAPSPEEQAADEEVRRSLPAWCEGLLDDLAGRPLAIARDVLERRFFAEEDEREGLREIGARWGVSGERVRQVEARLARRLRERLGEEDAA